MPAANLYRRDEKRKNKKRGVFDAGRKERSHMSGKSVQTSPPAPQPHDVLRSCRHICGHRAIPAFLTVFFVQLLRVGGNIVTVVSQLGGIRKY